MDRLHLPLTLKIGYALFLAIWTPVYWIAYGPANFLWICDTANFLIGIAILFEMRTLISAQAVGVLVLQLMWVLDVISRIVLGSHLIGGTEYMFDPELHLGLRMVSLFHVVIPILLVWLLMKAGYDRRGIRLQTIILWIGLTLTFLLTGPDLNINWVYGLFGKVQTLVHPGLYFLFCLLAYPLAIYVPTHLVLRKCFPEG